MERTQVVVVGAGPGGYAAAFHAADLGLQTTLIESDARPGGVCLLRGCIPSKALLHAARVIHESREAAAWGIRFAAPEIDLDALRAWKETVVDKLASGVRQLCQRRGVRLLRARASFQDSRTVRLTQTDNGAPRQLRFDNAIVATGSLPAVPAALRVDDERVCGSAGALDLPEVPGRLLVIGGGYIGLEMGTVYSALGSRVTVVEMTGNLLPDVDQDLVRPLRRRLEHMLHAIYLSTRVETIEPRGEGLLVSLSGQGVAPQQLFDRVLVAVGRQPFTAGLGLERTKVRVDEDGFIIVDGAQRTHDQHIFAIGDVAGQPMLAHKASREGKVAAETIAGQSAAFDNLAIPAVVFTDPEIAWCGVTEAEARRSGLRIRVTRFPWTASGRAHCIDRTEGLTKLIFDAETERVLGMGIVGSGAGELIAEGVLAVETAAVARDVAESIHAHPTLSETVGECAEELIGHATHIYGGRRARPEPARPLRD